MAIEKYTTAAIIIEAYDQGEHDRVYKAFTREYGLLMCHGKSIRKLESKMRAHILPRSISSITLVKGRDVWRLVGAENRPNTSPYLHDVAKLIQRFIKGEGSHTPLYDRIISFMEHAPRYDEQSARLLLYYIFLVDLGYADGRVIGANDIKEYLAFSIDDLYTHLLLTKVPVRNHVQAVLKEIHL